MRKQERDALNMTLVALACALLMVLPLVTTFDDLLTAWALQLGVNNPLQAIVPVESRMIVGLLSAVGIKAAAAGSTGFSSRTARTALRGQSTGSFSM